MHSRAINLRTVAAFLAVCAAHIGFSQDVDWRQQYRTPSLTAAEKIAEAVARDRAGDTAPALEAIDAALAVDSKCVAATYCKAKLLRDQGKLSEALALFLQVIADGQRTRVLCPPLAVRAMLDVGAMFTQLNQPDVANRCFSQAVLYSDEPHGQALAYRSLATNYYRQKRSWAASIAVRLGYKLDSSVFDEKTLRDYTFETGKDDYAQILQFVPVVPWRGHRTTLPVKPISSIAPVAEYIYDIVADPQGRYMILLAEGARGYYFAQTGNDLQISKVSLPYVIGCGALADGRLFLVPQAKTKLIEVEPISGKLVKSYPLGNKTTYSLAVLPRQHSAFFTVEDRRDYGVRRLDLDSGEVTETALHGNYVAGDPRQEFLFCLFRSQGTDRSVVKIDDIELRERHYTNQDFYTAVLFRAAVNGRKVVVTDVLDRAALQCDRLCISPDGCMLCLPGSQVYAPKNRMWSLPPGPSLPLIDAHEFGRLGGCISTYQMDSVIGAAINPVTSQCVLLTKPRLSRREGCTIALPSDFSRLPQLLDVSSNGVAAWSGNGDYLIVAGEKSGIVAYQNPLAGADPQRGAPWWKTIQAVNEVSPACLWAVRTANPRRELKAFLIGDQLPDVRELLGRRADAPHRDGCPDWRDLGDYTLDDRFIQAYCRARDLQQKDHPTAEDTQVVATMIGDSRDSAPLRLLLAKMLESAGKREEALDAYVNVVRSDAGRSNLTIDALFSLAAMFAVDKPQKAIACLAVVIDLDPANLAAVKQVLPLLDAHGYPAQAAQLRATNHLSVAAQPVAPEPAKPPATIELPQLRSPSGNENVLAVKELYASAVPSVVLLQIDHRHATGFCIANGGYIVTVSEFVNESNSVDVYPFQFKDGKPVKLKRTTASVVRRQNRYGLALLKCAKPPATLKPIVLTDAAVAAGAKVYALGNIALEQEMLEQTLVDGIVSHAKRDHGGKSYVEHTAPVGEGMSGAPLLNDRGQAIGVITLAAETGTLSFAIPSDNVRAALAK
jgi:S1-C subfamily serine protease